MNIIEKNLYEFYRIFGTVKKINFIQKNEYEMIHAGNKSWPQMIFNLNQAVDPQKLIPQISKEIDNNNYTRYFVVSESYISRKHTDLLKANAIIPVKIMTGMSIVSEEITNIITPNDCEISELNNEHLARFTDMIRKEFITPEMTFGNELLEEVNSRDEIQMTGLFLGKKLVSSLMVLISDGIAGLYFIVTGKEYQGKGYATTLIKFVLTRLFEKGVKEVVLHANHYSLALYKKTGFIEQDRFIVYEKL